MQYIKLYKILNTFGTYHFQVRYLLQNHSKHFLVPNNPLKAVKIQQNGNNFLSLMNNPKPFYQLENLI